MTADDVVTIFRQALFLIMKTAAPVLLTSLTIGLAVSIFQTVTSIQEQTLTFVPKILGAFLMLMLLGNWIINNLTSFMTQLWGSFTLYIR